mgnify:FL=1
MKLSTIGTIILAIIIMYYTISQVMNFLGINIEFYGSYMMWFFAIIIFWGFLPGQEIYFS